MKTNTFLQKNDSVYLYGLNLRLTDETLEKFRGIRYVLMQGSQERSHTLAKKIAQTIYKTDIRFTDIANLTPDSAYDCYRVGNTLSVSHGMGSASITTLLHDISKLMYYADNVDFEYIRIGTSGGIGIPAGVVILTDKVYQPDLVQGYTSSYLDQEILYPAHMHQHLNQRILEAQPNNLPFQILCGNTISADDFYLGQARFDGALPLHYDETVRHVYFDKIKQLSICNMEMESGAFASFCCRAEIPATMLAVTIINRAEGDQFSVTSTVLAEWAERAQQVAMHYLVTEAKQR